MKYAAILFDLEGTIIDTETIWDECSTEFLRRHGHTYNLEETKHLMMGRTLEEGAAILRDHHGFEGNPKELAQERREIFGELGEHIYSIADIGFLAKPKPDIFLYAAKKLGVDPASCLVLEDAPHGVTAARAAGMDCAAVTFSTTRERLTAAGADQVVDAFDQITLSS